MSFNLPFFPHQASSQAAQVDALYLFMVAITAFFSLLIAGLIVFFVIKFRRRGDDEVGAAIHGSLALELLWTIIPLFVVMGMFGWGAKIFFDMTRAPAGAMEIFVVGKQWMWKVQHASGQREINELHVPIGRPVKLVMGSEDVLHSYYIPAFRTKADVIPGRYNTMWFQATSPGTYHLFCAEYCGTRHSGMIGSVIAMEPAEFQKWLEGGPAAASPAEAGAKLFTDLVCASCHTGAPGGRGPSLFDVYGHEVELQGGAKVIADDAYLRESIVNPQAKIVNGFLPIMPTFQGMVSEEQLMQLIAYVKSLKGPQTGAPGPAQPPAAPAPEKK
jgi:cytochrome c oxidase subunit II